MEAIMNPATAPQTTLGTDANTNPAAAPATAPQPINVTTTISEEQMQAIADKAGTAAGEALANRQALAQSSKDAAGNMLATLAGTRNEDLTEDEAAFLEELRAEAAKQLTSEKGSVLLKLGLSVEQSEILSGMIESRRTTAKKTGLPTLSDLFTTVVLDTLKADSGKLYRSGKFSQTYGIDYATFEKAFSTR